MVTRTELLIGGGAAYRTERYTASVRYIPNRDLDSGFAWSILSGLELRPVERLAFELQWILDRYSSSSGPIFAGKNGNIFWARARYEVTPALTLGGGFKYVEQPPARTSPTDRARAATPPCCSTWSGAPGCSARTDGDASPSRAALLGLLLAAGPSPAPGPAQRPGLRGAGPGARRRRSAGAPRPRSRGCAATPRR